MRANENGAAGGKGRRVAKLGRHRREPQNWGNAAGVGRAARRGEHEYAQKNRLHAAPTRNRPTAPTFHNMKISECREADAGLSPSRADHTWCTCTACSTVLSD